MPPISDKHLEERILKPPGAYGGRAAESGLTLRAVAREAGTYNSHALQTISQ